ncbi:hypothetical protein PspLS_00023 [Pyricularia sp. CBS 133598]|nr:hypothetical protein PspLS_00023 [Pyricularia sp. CBS 133598]
MANDNDNQPFLPKYRDRDDEANRTNSEDSSRPQFTSEKSPSRRRWNCLSPYISHTLVFILTSLLWIFLIPNPRLARAAQQCSASQTSPSASTPTSTPTMVGMPKHSPVMATHNHGGGHSLADQLAAPLPGGSRGAAHNITSAATLVKCGGSTEEAKANGCHYDILLNHWVPEQCRDQEWVDEYKEDETWTGFADEARTQKIQGIDAMSNRDHYFTSTRDHVNHCVQLWKKQFLMLYEERNIDTISASWGHTEHCSQFLLDVTDKFQDFYDEPILVQVGWAGCYVRDNHTHAGM